KQHSPKNKTRRKYRRVCQWSEPGIAGLLGNYSAAGFAAETSASFETDNTFNSCCLPSRAVQEIDWPGARPISAVPIGVRIEILPCAISASPGYTRVTRRSCPSLERNSTVEPM